MTPREALIHAAFKGLAEGLMAAAEPLTAPAKEQRRPKSRRRSPLATSRRQMPLSPQMAEGLQQQFVPVDPRGPEAPPPTAQELDEMFRGNEAVEQLTRQMRMQQQAAETNPAPKPQEQPVVWGGIPDT